MNGVCNIGQLTYSPGVLISPNDKWWYILQRVVSFTTPDSDNQTCTSPVKLKMLTGE